MSSPPVASRRLSPQRSGASSSTLTSSPSYQPAQQNNSSPLAGSRGAAPPSRHAPNGSVTASPRTNGSPASKKGSIGRSGGFLLASTFRYGSLGRNERRPIGTSRGTSARDRRLPVEGSPQHANGATDTHTPAKEPIQFPISSGTHTGSVNTPLHESSSSPVSDIFGTPQGEDFAPEHDLNSWSHESNSPASQQSTTIDPSQIVSMALNLSEGRRRHMGSQGVPPILSNSSPRVISATAPVLQRPYNQGAGGSLRKHLQDQRRISRNLAPELNRSSVGARPTTSGFGGAETEPSLQIRLSQATIARADKARQYFELSGQYHRLLLNLPPLKTSKTVSEAPQDNVNSLPQYLSQRKEEGSSLGRAYNPLQLIRNRKARARARKSLDPAPEIWHDASIVNDWINVVENMSLGTQYIKGDAVTLPRYPPKQHEYISSTLHSSEDSSIANTSKSTRPRLDWFISPSELLADAYWLEQNQNKTVIEDRHGGKLYPAMVANLDPRASIDSRRSHHGSAYISAGSEKAPESDAESHFENRGRIRDMQQEAAGNDGSGRLKQAWHKARRRSRSPSPDMSPSESDKAKKLRTNKTRQVSDYLNIGPLERHLSTMIDQHGLAPITQSPELISPGTPNKWGLELQESRNGNLRSDGHGNLCENNNLPPHNLRLKTPDEGQRTNHIPSTAQHPERLSIDHSSPGSPMLDNLLIRSGTDTHQNGRKPSPTRKPIKNFFPFTRAEPKDGKRIESGSTAHEDSDRSSRRQSEDPKSVRQSLDFHSSPIRGQGLSLNTRTDESLTAVAASPPMKTKDGKSREADSAVRRFFKGGIIGLRRDATKPRIHKKKDVVYEDHSSTDDADTESMDESDTDTSGTAGKISTDPSKRSHKRTETSGSTRIDDPRVDRKGNRQYHIDLPTFRPSGPSPPNTRPTTPDQEKRPRQQSLMQSPLRDGLSPQMYSVQGATPTESTASLSIVPTQSYTLGSPEQSQPRSRRGLLSHFHSRSHSKSTNQRLAAALDDSKSGSAQDKILIPAPALASLDELRSHSLTVPHDRHHSHDRSRHWSISDANVRRASGAHQYNAISAISHADIARVRALLICTGVKAATLARRSQGLDASPPVLSETSGKVLQFPMGGEAISATARGLITTLDKESLDLHESARIFRTKTVIPLHDTLRELRIVVGECVERARTAGDEAVGFGALVTGQKTIEVRRVLDQMEKFRRKRRRRLRWIRRVGFGMLEWGVLLIMWQVWLVVIIFKTIFGIIRGTVRFGRWALWL
jgi:hypothetical protein